MIRSRATGPPADRATTWPARGQESACSSIAWPWERMPQTACPPRDDLRPDHTGIRRPIVSVGSICCVGQEACRLAAPAAGATVEPVADIVSLVSGRHIQQAGDGIRVLLASAELQSRCVSGRGHAQKEMARQGGPFIGGLQALCEVTEAGCSPPACPSGPASLRSSPSGHPAAT